MQVTASRDNSLGRTASDRSLCLQKGWLGGLAMSAPFYAEFFSWYWVAALALPIILLALIRRERMRAPHLAILPAIILLVAHAVALLYSHTPFAPQVFKDLVIASFLLFVYLLADEDLQAGFFAALIPLAIFTAVFGLVKAALLDRGYLFGFMLESCAYYPAGSAMCVNYNNLGMMWLVAALGCMKTRFWWAIPLLVAAGALSSSRRFIVLLAVLPFAWIWIEGRSVLFKVALVTLLSAGLIWVVSDPTSFERYRYGAEPYTLLALKDAVDEVVGGHPLPLVNDASVKINRSTPEAMLSTMADGTAGTASRAAFWQLGFSMLSWLPQGWSYHKVFSCAFSPCTAFNYPHMSVLTEWIIGGVLLGLVAIAFYIMPFWQLLRVRQARPIILFLISLPYSLISGDTVFSLPICLACMLVALSNVSRRMSGVSNCTAPKNISIS